MAAPETDPRLTEFFDAGKAWHAELAALREIFLTTPLPEPLSETFKWRSPCYCAAGGNIATLWRYKAFAAVGFFKGVLLGDAAGLLVAPGDNSRSMRMIRFADVAQVRAAAPALGGLIREAVALERDGRRVEMPMDDLALPPELAASLDADAALKAAFLALTPGRRRAYALHVGQAKQPATRLARIRKCVPKILAGKGMHDR